jgi:hypothetical protein
MLIQIVLEISQHFNGYFRCVCHHSIVTGPLVSRMDIVEQGINERCTAKAVFELYEFLRLQMCGYMVWLQDGVKETGVSVAYTVRAMDSGPIIASGHMDVDPDIKAPELLSLLFKKGTELLLQELPSILDGSAADKAIEQDSSLASMAPKVSKLRLAMV